MCHSRAYQIARVESHDSRGDSPYSRDVLDIFHQNHAFLARVEIRRRERPRRRLADLGLFVPEHRATCSTRIEDGSSKLPGRTCQPLQRTCHGARPRPRMNLTLVR